jgi:rhomboid protease GluP
VSRRRLRGRHRDLANHAWGGLLAEGHAARISEARYNTRVEPENAARREPTPWITIALIAANLAAFAWELASGAGPMNPSPTKLLEVGGNLPALTLGGQWWRLGSAMFLHGGALHIGMNLLCLWQVRVAEVAFGRAAYATIYIVSGLLGGIATALHVAPNVVSVGASGAVFGVYGAFFALLLVRRAEFPRDAWDKIVRQLAMFLGINFVLGFSVPGIDMSAHLGGLAAGALGGAALVAGTKRGPAALARTIALGAVGLAIVAGVLVVKHAPPPTWHVAPDIPVLKDFQDTEDTALDRASQIMDQHDAHTLGDADAAAQVERDALVPWKALRARVEAFVPSPPFARVFDAVHAYLASRQSQLEALAAELRHPDDATTAAFKAARHQAALDQQAVQRALDALRD